MPPTSIDTDEITGATIDNQEVQEITVDGQTVFTAGPVIGANGYDLNFASFVADASIPNVTRPFSADFSPDGLNLFIIDLDANDNITHFTCASPYDIQNITFQSELNYNSASNPTGIHLQENGNAVFVAESTTDKLLKFNMSTPFDLSSASTTPDQSLTFNYDYGPGGIDFSPDGLFLFSSDQGSADINRHDLGSPFDLSSTSSTPSQSTSSQFNGKGDPDISSDGTILTETNTSSVQYDLSTPFDLNTISSPSTFNLSSRSIKGGHFNNTGGKFWLTIDGSSVQIEMYDVS